MSKIYTLGASRTLKTQNDEYQSLTRFKDFKMKHIEKMTKLLGTVAVQICWKGDASDNGVFNYNPIYSFDVHTDTMNPLEPIAIQYPMLQGVDDVADDSNPKFCYWDAEKIMYIDENGAIISEEKNPYGFLPFVFLHKDHQLDRFFCYPALDVISVNTMVDILMTELNLGARFNAFGTWVISGYYEEQKFDRVGSNQMLTIPDDASAQILSTSVNISEILKLARAMLELLAQNNHLNITFDESNRDRPESGIALKIKELDTKQKFTDDLGLWYHYEKQIYEIERKVAGYNGLLLPSDFGVDFNEPEYPMTIPDEIAWNNYLVANDLTTKVKLLQKYNKDLNPQQAQKIIDENKEENANQSLIDFVRELKKLNEVELKVPQKPIEKIIDDPRQYALDFVEMEFARHVELYSKAHKIGNNFSKELLNGKTKS